MESKGNMKDFIREFGESNKKFVFIGGAGTGKSELALNLAVGLAGSAAGTGTVSGEAPRDAAGLVDLFDLDQTKPLFRSRDLAASLASKGVNLHFQDQYLDSPQAVGGVEKSLADPGRYTILDAGGDKGGARMIGRYAQLLERDGCMVFYVINPFRPWSEDIYDVDATLSSVLAASRLQKFHILVNPNVGHETDFDEWCEGLEKAREMLEPFAKIEALGASEKFAGDVQEEIPLLAIHPFIDYGL